MLLRPDTPQRIRHIHHVIRETISIIQLQNEDNLQSQIVLEKLTYLLAQLEELLEQPAQSPLYAREISYR
jgi:hypothetical protein